MWLQYDQLVHVRMGHRPTISTRGRRVRDQADRLARAGAAGRRRRGLRARRRGEHAALVRVFAYTCEQSFD